MKFVFMKPEFKGTYVPDAVFDGLYDARNNDLKVILYVIKNEETDPLKISSDLNISHSAAVSSLMYWADKGLIHCEEETAKPKKKKALSSEVIATMAADPGVKALCQNLQIIFGSSLSENYTNQFVSLYLEENIPVDVILPIAQHYISLEEYSPAYILKVIRSWQKKYKFENGADVDEYLALQENRSRVYEKVCKIFGLDAAKLKTSEKTIINRWQEKYNMSFDMIEESFIRAGNLAGIAYCNGILKNWSQKGYKTPKDLESEISNITQSKRNIDSQDDLIIKNITNVPVFED